MAKASTNRCRILRSSVTLLLRLCSSSSHLCFALLRRFTESLDMSRIIDKRQCSSKESRISELSVHRTNRNELLWTSSLEILTMILWLLIHMRVALDPSQSVQLIEWIEKPTHKRSDTRVHSVATIWPILRREAASTISEKFAKT